MGIQLSSKEVPAQCCQTICVPASTLDDAPQTAAAPEQNQAAGGTQSRDANVQVVGSSGSPASQGILMPPGTGHAHVLISGCGYAGTQYALRSLDDTKRIEKWCKECDIEDVVILTDHHELFGTKDFSHEPTKEHIREFFKSIGARCGPGDIFVWYFAGHGIQVPDEEGEEESGKDDALLLVDDKGQLGFDKDHHISRDTVLTDDEINVWLADALPSDTTIVAIVDACHSGTVLDLNNKASPLYTKGRYVISISACADSEKAAESAQGGLLTESMMLAASAMDQQLKTGSEVVSCATFFQEMKRQAESLHKSLQHMSMIALPEQDIATRVPWPFHQYVKG